MSLHCAYCRKTCTADACWVLEEKLGKGQFSSVACLTCYRDIIEPELAAFRISRKNSPAP